MQNSRKSLKSGVHNIYFFVLYAYTHTHTHTWAKPATTQKNSFFSTRKTSHLDLGFCACKKFSYTSTVRQRSQEIKWIQKKTEHTKLIHHP